MHSSSNAPKYESIVHWVFTFTHISLNIQSLSKCLTFTLAEAGGQQPLSFKTIYFLRNNYTGYTSYIIIGRGFIGVGNIFENEEFGVKPSHEYTI